MQMNWLSSFHISNMYVIIMFVFKDAVIVMSLKNNSAKV